MNDKHVVFITAIFGAYERCCKPYTQQSIPCDFICFTDNPKLEANGWELDTTPYHYLIRDKNDKGYSLNSFNKNIHTFNKAKYYKIANYNIPRLQRYDVVIWIDGSLEIISEFVAEYCLAREDDTIITWRHEMRNDILINEVNAAMGDRRYASIFWNNQSSPFQDIRAEYLKYRAEGFQDVGVWVTCFLAYNQRDFRTHQFLSLWYKCILENANHDQVSFPYVVWKTDWRPCTLPNEEVAGAKPHVVTDWYKKYNHGV